MIQNQTIMVPEFSALPFFEERVDGSRSFWSPPAAGRNADLHALGSSYAAELHEMIHVTENAALFGSVIRDMIARGDYAALEIGFCTYFGGALAR